MERWHQRRSLSPVGHVLHSEVRNGVYAGERRDYGAASELQRYAFVREVENGLPVRADRADVHGPQAHSADKCEGRSGKALSRPAVEYERLAEVAVFSLDKRLEPFGRVSVPPVLKRAETPAFALRSEFHQGGIDAVEARS